jgi:hypothetical protein
LTQIPGPKKAVGWVRDIHVVKKIAPAESERNERRRVMAAFLWLLESTYLLDFIAAGGKVIE